MPSHLEDTPQKIAFVEGRWLAVPGGSAAAEATDETIYLSATLRNVGAGIAVLHGWRFYPHVFLEREPPAAEESPA